MVGLALCAGGLPYPFSWRLAGPAHRAMSYEPFSRMAGAAPLAVKLSRLISFVGRALLALLLLSAGR